MLLSDIFPASVFVQPRIGEFCKHYYQHYLTLNTAISQTTMSLTLLVGGARASVRHFSAKPPAPESRANRLLVLACLASGIVLPFIPPALESSREKKFPSNQGKQYAYPSQACCIILTSAASCRFLTAVSRYPPLCFHAR